MTSSNVAVLERSVHSANLWLKQVSEHLGADDPADAYRALRAVLHTLRDRLTVDESAQLAAQLPALIRGVYYDGWNPSATPQRYATAAEFLRRVADEARLHGPTEASVAVEATMAVVREHVSEGELDDVMAVLPAGVRSLLAAT